MVLTYDVPTGRTAPIPIKLPIYRVVPNAVQKIAVDMPNGKQLVELTLVADVEAIALRNERDEIPMTYLRFALSTVRRALLTVGGEKMDESVGERLRGAFGSLGRRLGRGLAEAGDPDTRAWMSLPARIQAARFRVANDVDTVVVTTYDSGNRKLASEMAKLDQRGPTFMYGRSLDDKLLLHVSRGLWVNAAGQKEEASR
jgi:uncharacterized protein